MRTPALLIAGFAAIASTAAIAGNDDPHRDWGRTLTLDMSLADATACVAREMSRKGKVLVLPVEGGNDVDFFMGSMLGGSAGDAWERFLLRSSGVATTMTVLYRHPATMKWVNKDVERMSKGCLKVSRTHPD